MLFHTFSPCWVVEEEVSAFLKWSRFLVASIYANFTEKHPFASACQAIVSTIPSKIGIDKIISTSSFTNISQIS